MSIEAMKQALAKFESLWEIGIDAVYKVELLPEIQALRQAIKQAEQIEPEDWRHHRHFHEQVEKQQALDKKADNARELGLDYEPEPVAWMVRDSIDGSWYPCAFENPAGAIKGESKPLYAVPQQAEKQEPIAWMVYTLDGASAFVTDNPNDFTESHSCFALYTAPPRKEWVGLTDEEITELDYSGTRIDFVRAIEAKLKEKNGG